MERNYPNFMDGREIMTDHRFIEESFPTKEIGKASSKEKNIRTGNISTLHMWWARKPLASSRATTYAALIPAPRNIDEWEQKRRFIIDLSQWENSSNLQYLEKARSEILKANNGFPPKILDPFSGGGSLPLESLRLGCDTYAGEYNPVAILIEKATLEFPQKYGHPFAEIHNSYTQDGNSQNLESNNQPYLFDSHTTDRNVTVNPLYKAVNYWGNWVLDEARKELAQYYPVDNDSGAPICYLWAHTIPCQNPSCHADIPLLHHLWIVNKDKKKIAFFPYNDKGKIGLRLIGDSHEPWPEGFDPDEGTVKRAIVVCPLCKSVIDQDTTRKLFHEKQSKNRMIAVVSSTNHGHGKIYRLPSNTDEKIFIMAEKALEEKIEKLTTEWGINPVPDEPIVRVPVSFGVINVWVYGMDNWGALYNPRQKLALITLTEKVRLACNLLAEQTKNSEFGKAIGTYLGLALSRLTNRMSILAYWFVSGEKIQPAFVLQGLGMVWNYVEMNPLNTASGGWKVNLFDILNVIDSLSKIYTPAISVEQLNAIHLPYSSDFFDAVITDPPYYDNVPYSYISDYFYVWLKRSIGNLYPELFTTPLTPKENEIVAYTQREGGVEAGKRLFEENLKKAFIEISRVLKPNGITVIVYAHKSTAGWESIINAILDSGLVVTSAWPLSTEMGTRSRAQESATLSSSIYIVARKYQRESTGFFNDVRTDLKRHLDTKLKKLWEEGISGADFFIAAIGSAIEIFGKYERVIDYEGEIVRADRLLEEVRTIATDYAVHQILHNGFSAEISGLTRLYILWRWNYQEAIVQFDEARKLAQSCGIDISQMWGKNNFVKKEKEFIKLLGPQNRRLEDLDDPKDLIDILHKVLLLWEKGRKSEMIQIISEKGYGKSESFFRVAQAISETLPIISKEKQLLDGFLAGKERVQSEVEKIETQGTLFT